MGIRALCAAAAVVVGVGSAAEAATVASGSYAVQLTLVSNYWRCSDCNGPEPKPEPEPAPYEGLNVGDVVPAVLSLDFPYPNYVQFSLSWGDTVVSDLLGRIRENVYWRSDNKWELEILNLDGVLSGTLVDGYYSSDWTQYATLAFVETEPAPVPLPATVVLLSIGVGALALMRRRRRLLS